MFFNTGFIYLRVHIHTGKGQLLFNVARTDHLCKICKLINWLQVIFSSSTKNIVLNSTSCPDDAQKTVEAPHLHPASPLTTHPAHVGASQGPEF